MATAIRTSEEIKKDVVDQLYWDSRVDASDVDVEVVDAMVRLKGTVPDLPTMEAVRQNVWLVPGVRFVHNRLKVKHREGFDIPADGKIGEKVREILRWEPHLGTTNFDVSVISGWVTIKGTVDSYFKKSRASEVVRGLRGVLGVGNEIAVVPSHNPEDREIADNILAALDRNIHVGAESIDVQVRDGVVTLSGSVRHLPAFEAAQGTVEHTRGVIAVKNQLTIG